MSKITRGFGSRQGTEMRIAMVHNQYVYKGGEDTVFAREARMLRDAGHEVLEVIRRNPVPSKRPLRFFVDLLNSKWNERAARKIRQEIDRFAPEVVHIHNFWFCLSLATHAELSKAGYPVVQTLHNYRLLCLNAMLFRDGVPCERCVGTDLTEGIRNRCYRGSQIMSGLVRRMVMEGRRRQVLNKSISAYICLTESSRQLMIRGGLPVDKLYVKPNAVKVQPKGTPQKKRKKQVLFVGRLSYEKGAGLLAGLARRLPCKVLVCGDGPMASELKSGAPSNLALLGQVSPEQVAQHMRDSMLLVFPSLWYEGLPMTILEAAASGLPCVVSRLGSAAEVVKDGTTGLHFAPGDEEDCARKVRTILDDVNLFSSMSKQAWARAEEVYSLPRNLDTLLRIYERVMVRSD